jgi:hypothetical protein
VDSSLYAITPGDLHYVSWGLRPPHAFYTDISPAVTGNRLYVGTKWGWLYSWSIPQNDLQIFYEWGWADAGSPIIGADGTVYAPFGPDLLALHPADGSEQWAVRSPGEKLFETPAIGADGTIYVGTWGNIGDGAASIPVGEICAFHPDGSLDWNMSVIGQVHSSPAIVKYRTESGGQFALYIGLHDSLLAMNVDSPGVAESPWPMDRGNLKRNARCGDAMIRMLLSFREKVMAYKFPINIQTSLVSKLAAAQQSLIKEKVKPAKNQVEAFIHEVRALRGKKILSQDADQLITAAQRIVSFL